MIPLSPSIIGCRVVYDRGNGPERGIVVSVTDQVAYVRYRGQPSTAPGQPTVPEHLSLEDAA